MVSEATPIPLSWGKKLAFGAGTALVFLVCLEGLARLVVAPRGARIHREHENMITVLGLPSLNATMEFDPTLFWRLKDGLRDHLVEGEVRGTPMRFQVSTFGGLRSPERRDADDGLRVIALGDSCTFGLGVDDDATWPAQLERELGEQGVAAEVVNAGVPGYTAYQGMRWLEEHGLDLAADLLIVSFGFNDRDLWSSRSDFDTAKQLEDPPWLRVALKSRLYLGLRQLLRPAPLEPALPDDPREAKAALQARIAAGAVPRLSPEQFSDVLRSIVATARRAGIEVIFAAWPYRSQVEQELRQTVRYQTLQAEVASELGVAMVNLAGPFIDAGGALFVDHVHASREGNRVAARALLPAVLAVGKP